MITLLVNYYKNIDRQAEIDYCLNKNIENNLIDKIIVFHNNIEVPKNDKIKSVSTDQNIMSFTDFFNYGNNIEGIKIIANSDIYFNDTLSNCNRIKNNDIYALSRWEYVKGNLELTENEYSQDCWIWKDKIFVNVYFGLGIPGCDNVLAYTLKDLGYNIINPALTIQSFHHHYSKVRNYEIKEDVNKYRIKGKFTKLKIIELNK